MRKGFTLIELLAVIVILVIIFSIIITSYRMVMNKVWTTRCSANLKELHKSLIIYVNDEDRKISDNKDMVSNTVFTSADETVNVILSDYAQVTYDSIKCPAAENYFGYFINENLFNTSGYAVDSSNSKIEFSDLKSSNILIYESDSTGNLLTRHGDLPLGITVYGEIVTIDDASDLDNQNT